MQTKTGITSLRRPALMSLLLAALMNGSLAGEVTQAQSPDAFQSALRDQTTSPRYVMFTVIDAESGQHRLVCTVPMWLGLAIRREQELESGQNPQARPSDTAFSNESRVFRFRAESLEKSRINTAEGLQAARNYLAGLSNEEIKDRFASNGKSRVYNHNYATDSAFACALIERGFTPRMADIGRSLYVEP